MISDNIILHLLYIYKLDVRCGWVRLSEGAWDMEDVEDSEDINAQCRR